MNYYFIGGQSAATAEIIKILQEKKVSFIKVEPSEHGLYCVSEDAIKLVVDRGEQPILIGIDSGVADIKVVKKYRHHVNPSPLEEVAIWENSPLSPWQELVLAHDEDYFNEFEYSTEIMRELCRRGFSRDDIDKVRAYDRAERGISEAEEAAAEECVQKHCAQNKGLLVITDLPHRKYRAVLDRIFWMQPMQNAIIFTQEGRFLYAGFADIAWEMQKHFRIFTTHYCWVSGYFGDMAEQLRIIRYLVRASKTKKIDGII